VLLDGAIHAIMDMATGKYEADLELEPTKGKFRIFGFLPASANVAFEQVGKTTGALSGGVLSSESSMYVNLQKVKVFGFPIGGGANCQTVEPADIGMASKPGFDPQAGGKLSGEYTLSKLAGCGPLNNLISAFTAGGGNTVDVNLKPIG